MVIRRPRSAAVSLANVFRRLSRICRYYHASPRFLCSSATIANPVELARAVCQREFIRIDRDGSPAPEKRYFFLQPPKIYGKDNQYYGQVQSTAVAAAMTAQLAEEGQSFLTFAKSRRNVEVILKETRDMLDEEGISGTGPADRISGYRGGYTISGNQGFLPAADRQGRKERQGMFQLSDPG